MIDLSGFDTHVLHQGKKLKDLCYIELHDYIELENGKSGFVQCIERVDCHTRCPTNFKISDIDKYGTPTSNVNPQEITLRANREDTPQYYL